MKKTIRKATRILVDFIPAVISGTQLEFFTMHKITTTQFITLMAVFYPKRCTTGYLAKRLHVTMPTVTGQVDRLKKLGLVERTPSERDRRRVYIQLTPKGIDLMEGYRGVIRKRWGKLFTMLKPREIKHFTDIIEKLRLQIQKTEVPDNEK